MREGGRDGVRINEDKMSKDAFRCVSEECRVLPSAWKFMEMSFVERFYARNDGQLFVVSVMLA